jgi:hypothetical protein
VQLHARLQRWADLPKRQRCAVSRIPPFIVGYDRAVWPFSAMPLRCRALRAFQLSGSSATKRRKTKPIVFVHDASRAALVFREQNDSSRT